MEMIGTEVKAHKSNLCLPFHFYVHNLNHTLKAALIGSLGHLVAAEQLKTQHLTY